MHPSAVTDGHNGISQAQFAQLVSKTDMGRIERLVSENGADAWRQRLRALWACGYTGFWMFDNFGNPICEATQPRVLDQLLDSLLRQNQRRASRTLYYYDVLAFGEHDAARAARAIALHTR